MSQVGVVIIGRNEGERLKRSVASVSDCSNIIVYVDSGSSDGSVEFAKQAELHVVELDTGIPFSAGRARNEGMKLLLTKYPDLTYIQFVDGDCEVAAQWMQYAQLQLEKNAQLAIVCGRRSERFPENSVYNRLCDMEWNTPVGVANSCGGDFMARVSALGQVNGFNEKVVAGEEPDLCYRLRNIDWQIERLDHDMTWHDAQILHFSQWWKRTLRSGHAYAQTSMLHWRDPERFNVKNVASIACWGGFMPALLLLMLVSANLFFMFLILLLYGFMVNKISRYLMDARGFSQFESYQYGFFTMLGKTPQMLGVVQFFLRTLLAKDHEIIEYKS